ncbi:MAG: hypothetical protein PCFJNLEI_03231 [Verrucomicrobiae bacterium]|nr:hypothetical protein [Verrucomicrobiae bacterium]
MKRAGIFKKSAVGLGVATAPRAGRSRPRLRAGDSPPYRPALRKEIRATLAPGLERDTQLNPVWVAEAVVQEAARYVAADFPTIYATWLAEKAEHCYAGNQRFHRRLRGAGNAGRGWLYAFMRHWLAGLLHRERPDLYSQFPYTWVNGQQLTGRATGLCVNYVEGCRGKSDWPTRPRPNPLLRRS